MKCDMLIFEASKESCPLRSLRAKRRTPGIRLPNTLPTKVQDSLRWTTLLKFGSASVFSPSLLDRRLGARSIVRVPSARPVGRGAAGLQPGPRGVPPPTAGGPGRGPMPKGKKRELRPQPLLDLAAARAAVRAGGWKEEPHLRRLLGRLLRASRAGRPAAGVAAVAGELGLPQGMAAALDADFAWLTRCVVAAAPRSFGARPAGPDAGVPPAPQHGGGARGRLGRAHVEARGPAPGRAPGGDGNH